MSSRAVQRSIFGDFRPRARDRTRGLGACWSCWWTSACSAAKSSRSSDGFCAAGCRSGGGVPLPGRGARCRSWADTTSSEHPRLLNLHRGVHALVIADPVRALRDDRQRPADRVCSTRFTSSCSGWWSLDVDGLVVHRRLGRVFRPALLVDRGHDGPDRGRGASDALPALETMTICLYFCTAFEKDKRRSVEGRAEVLRLRLGLLGALPVRTEPALRPDRHHAISRDLAGALTPSAGGDVTGLRGEYRGGGRGAADAGGLRVQGGGGAVPPVGARRVRRSPGAGDGLDRHRLEDGELRGADEGPAPRPAPVGEPGGWLGGQSRLDRGRASCWRPPR